MKIFWLVLGSIVLLAGLASWWVFASIGQAGSHTSAIEVTISEGAGIREIAKQLYSSKAISSQQAWTIFALVTDQARAILPGTYTIAVGQTGKEILTAFAKGPVDNREATVTIREGLNAKQIADLLEKADVVGAQAFLNVITSPSASGLDLAAYPILASKPATVDLEGYLFPDTYRFFKRSEPVDVVEKFLSTLETRYDATMRTRTTEFKKTPHEILTMASILEAELRSAGDRAKAADLFWRRISIGMPIQADTTILYALGRTTGSVSFEDLKVNSLYNTYTYKGLPPGPISSPGLNAIKAAMNPEANTALYYLSAPDGTTYFATTFEQHVKNKNTYLK